MLVLDLPISSKQAQLRASPERIRGFVAGRGSGKTEIGAIDFLLELRAGEVGLVISPTYGDIYDTTLPKTLLVAERLGVFVRKRESPFPQVWIRSQDGGVAEIWFKSGDRPERLAGASVARLWLDEASMMTHQAFLTALPTLRHRGRMGACLLTFTPKGRRHWTYDIFYEPTTDAGRASARPRPNTFLVQAHTLENPFAPPEYYETIRGQYSSALAEQELAGEFIDIQGLMFRREWFEILPATPAEAAARVRYWDKAATHGSGDYSAGLLMSRDGLGRYTIEDVVRGQWSYHQRERILKETAEADAARSGPPVRIVIEQEPGSGGKESALATIRLLSGFDVRKDNVSQRRNKGPQARDAKTARAAPLAAQAEAGNVRLVRAGWNQDLLEELIGFPEYAHDDQVDAAAGAFQFLAKTAAVTDAPRVLSRDFDRARHGVRLER